MRYRIMIQNEAWNGFKGKLWRDEVNVRDFIQNNYTPYEGDSSFLEAPTEATARKEWCSRYGNRSCNWSYSLWCSLYL